MTDNMTKRQENTDNVAENNKLIAEFMGIGNIPYYNNGLLYHSSWDWLIPVVEKIGSIDKNERVTHMYYTEITPNGTTISPSIYTIDTKWLIRHNSRDMLKNTYKAVIEFIKRYNNKK